MLQRLLTATGTCGALAVLLGLWLAGNAGWGDVRPSVSVSAAPRSAVGPFAPLRSPVAAFAPPRSPVAAFAPPRSPVAAFAPPRQTATTRPGEPAAPDAAAQGATVTRYCVGCHNDRLKTAGLVLDPGRFRARR